MAALFEDVLLLVDVSVGWWLSELAEQMVMLTVKA